MSDVDHSIKLSKRIDDWLFELRSEGETGLSTISNIQGIMGEVKEFEARLERVKALPQKLMDVEIFLSSLSIPYKTDSTSVALLILQTTKMVDNIKKELESAVKGE